MTDLTTQTPAEIDTQLTEIMERLSRAQSAANFAAGDLKDARKAVAASPDTLYLAVAVERALARLDKAEAAIDAAEAEAAPFHAEFTRRGGWTRAFKVTSAGGHIHRTTACQTCFVTTSFAWLPQVSGMPESQIVDLAASAACTICYPTAPVDKPTALFTKDEEAAQAERKARADAKAVRDAKKAAAAIDPIKVDYDTLRTITAARSWLTNAHAWNLDHPSYPMDKVTTVAIAIAAKEGKTVEQVMAEAAKRAAKRR